MNYWPTDEADLPDIQQPIYHLLQQMAHYGQATARDYYHAQGWVTHSITNPWGFTAPGEGAQWGSSLTGTERGWPRISCGITNTILTANFYSDTIPSLRGLHNSLREC